MPDVDRRPVHSIGEAGETLFADYLTQHGLRFDRHVPSGQSVPDFEVSWAEGSVVCEVKTLTKRVTNGAIDVYGPIRQVINGARRQGAGSSGERPYVLVIYGPGWILDDVSVPGAMFGSVGLSFAVDTTTGSGDMDSAETRFLGGGRLQPEMNRRFSAVVILTKINPGSLRLNRQVADRTQGMSRLDGISLIMREAGRLTDAGLLSDDERAPRVDVFLNPHASVDLPEGLFCGPYDRLFGVVDDRFTQIAVGVNMNGFD